MRIALEENVASTVCFLFAGESRQVGIGPFAPVQERTGHVHPVASGQKLEAYSDHVRD